MENTIKTEVLIVGAGPTGLSLACQFIRYGIDFVIIDKKETITPYSKALAVQARTLEIYEQLGLDRQAVAQGTAGGKARIVEAGEIKVELNLTEIGTGLSAYPFILILEQSKNERLLYEYIRSHAKEVLWQSEIESLSQDESGVTAKIKTAGSKLQTVEAKYLVGCDGAKSPVRHLLDLHFGGSTIERLFYVADAEIDWKFPHDGLIVCLVKESILVFFSMPGEKRYRIVGTFPEEFSKSEGEVLYKEIEQRIKEEAGFELDITKVHWFSTYKVHSRHVETFRKGRCFLAGDSAHVHTPAGGQGMNTGIQDAYNLAWKLAYVIQGKAAEKILDSYDAERVENAKNLLKTTDRFFNLAAGNDWFVHLIRDHVFPQLAEVAMSFASVRKAFFTTISQIAINYRHHALSRPEGDETFKVKAGDRLPYYLVDGKGVYDRLREPKFHLLVFSDGTADFQTMETDLESSYAGVVDFHIVPLYPQIAEIFGTEKSFQVMLRPDNYIAFLSPDISMKKTGSYFEEIGVTK